MKPLKRAVATQDDVHPGQSWSEFTHDQWLFIETHGDLLTEKSVHRRLRFALRFLYPPGLRLVEGVQARCDDLRRVDILTPRRGHHARLEAARVREGEKERIVSVPDSVVDELSVFRFPWPG